MIIRKNIVDLYNKKGRPLVLDGAMGSLIQERGYELDKNLWASSIIINHPEVIRSIHEEYINAGAEIITTNTFRTNPQAIIKSNSGKDKRGMVAKSVKAALDARADSDILIAGSNAPAEDCYQKERTISQKELQFNHQKHIDLLWESGCDLIWNETHSHLDEIVFISSYCADKNFPFVMNLFFTDDLKILSGEKLSTVIPIISDYHPAAIGLNCIHVAAFSKFISNYNFDTNWGFYLNCGSGSYSDPIIKCGISPVDYLNEVKKWVQFNPLFVGSCCGSSPLHTKTIRNYFNELY